MGVLIPFQSHGIAQAIFVADVHVFIVDAVSMYGATVCVED